VKEPFPEVIQDLPMVELGLPGAAAWLSQDDGHQILFMRFTLEAVIPPHAHAAQWGVVLEGRIDLTIGGEARTFGRGDRYFIPAQTEHSAHIHAGYADITFFADPARYRARQAKSG
jgi:quercetin dioxygenase-like cupin family protein